MLLWKSLGGGSGLGNTCDGLLVGTSGWTNKNVLTVFLPFEISIPTGGDVVIAVETERAKSCEFIDGDGDRDAEGCYLRS